MYNSPPVPVLWLVFCRTLVTVFPLTLLNPAHNSEPQWGEIPFVQSSILIFTHLKIFRVFMKYNMYVQKLKIDKNSSEKTSA